MSDHPARAPAGPRLYHELAEWYPLLTPVADYAEEAACYRRQFESHCRRPPRSLLDLGSGGGHNAAHLKQAFSCTLVDLSRAMLALSRRLNPECEHLQGDMRRVRLGRRFDCVLVHDAVSYMATRDDLALAVATAFAHTVAGGVALFQPDFVAETFMEGIETGGSDSGGRGLRYLEWRWLSQPGATTYVNDMAYLLRRPDGGTEVVHERHLMGLFPRATWLDIIAAAGFQAMAVPFEHRSNPEGVHEVFLGLRPETDNVATGDSE
jgi:SAM-dependent methyltransferase